MLLACVNKSGHDENVSLILKIMNEKLHKMDLCNPEKNIFSDRHHISLVLCAKDNTW
jgi:hypothetical protein